MSFYSGERRGVSEAGRSVLARAVSIDHDWALPASSTDKLIEAVSGLSDADLDAAWLFADHLQEAVVCVQLQRAASTSATESTAHTDNVDGA